MNHFNQNQKQLPNQIPNPTNEQMINLFDMVYRPQHQQMQGMQPFGNQGQQQVPPVYINKHHQRPKQRRPNLMMRLFRKLNLHHRLRDAKNQKLKNNNPMLQI
jgi:hypothetical protein